MNTVPVSDEPCELVHLDLAGAIATITLDSPHNRNALSRQLRHELLERVETVIRDVEVRVLVLTHTGSVFCVGADLTEARGAGGGGAERSSPR